MAFTSRSHDSKLFHPAAKRVGMDGEEFRGAVRSVDDPIRLLKRGQDVAPRAGFQAFGRRSRYHSAVVSPLSSLPWGFAESMMGRSAAVAEANTVWSISSVGPFDKMTARSRMFSNSRTFPGHA